MTKAGIRLEVLLNATTRRDEQGDVIGTCVGCWLPLWFVLNPFWLIWASRISTQA